MLVDLGAIDFQMVKPYGLLQVLEANLDIGAELIKHLG